MSIRHEGEAGPSPRKAPGLSTFLHEHREEVLHQWEQAVRALPAARTLERPRLLDHIPALLDRLARLVEPSSEGTLSAQEAEQHALERLDTGYDLGEVVAEYGLLRRCFLRLLGPQAVRLPGAELELLDEFIDHAIARAVTSYARARERTLLALDRISEAALTSQDIEAFLPRLMRVLLEMTEPVDSVVLLLRDGNVLRARAAVGLEEEVVAQGLSLKIGEGYAGKIAAERQPVALASATDPLVKSEVLRRSGIRALYGVPLLQGDELIGVAYMGSCTAFDFSEEDKLVFRAMTARATTLLAHARLAAELWEEEERFRLLVEGVQDYAIIMLDPQGCVVSWNPGAERLFGYPPGEIIGRHVSRLYAAEDAQGQPERDLQEAGTAGRFEASRPRVRRDGSWFWSSAVLTALRDEAGRLRGFAEVTHDITEPMRALEETERRAAELEAVIQSIPDAVYIGDASGIHHTNAAALAMLGFSSQEELRQNIALLGEKLQNRWLKTGERIRPEEEPFAVALSGRPTVGEVRARNLKTGADVIVRCAAAPIRLKGKLLGAVAVNSDITEQMRREEELVRLSVFRERLLGIVGHDLRNPLGAIAVSAHLLLRQGALREGQARAVARISSSADRMTRIINDLLDFTQSRLGGGISVAPRPMVLGEVCQRTLEELEITHPDRKLCLEVKGDTRGRWDPDRVAQVVSNLVGNALTYGDPENPVQVTVRNLGSEVSLEVHNQGAPISADLLPHLFDPFRRGPTCGGEPRTSKGLGLGLFIVQQIVAAHGGRLEVRSSAEAGTTFSVRWPHSL